MVEAEIFRAGSTTYYFSSRFFPPTIREDVFRLYSFVRVADDYVDTVPQRADAFKALRAEWERAKADDTFRTQIQPDDMIDARVIKNIIHCQRKYEFDQSWVPSFLDSMQADLQVSRYETIGDTLRYVYGSAEVIGLMMARITGLPDQAMEYAQLQGRAMQFINFIRDIAEDNQLGRCYFPADELARYNLPDLQEETARQMPDDFAAFMHFQLDRYNEWQADARRGYRYIPRRLRIPIVTAADMYSWTGRQIRRDPLVVFDRKVKPDKLRVTAAALRASLTPAALVVR